MPMYEYKVAEGHRGCPKCRDSFETVQRIKEASLATCPACGAPIECLLFAVGIATPKTNSELKDLGFTKLVRRDSGVYEKVTARGDDSRIVEAGKPDTLPDLSKTISD